MFFPKNIIAVIVFAFPFYLSSQSKPYHNVYAISNTAELHENSKFFAALISNLERDTLPSSLLFLGDFSSNKDISSKALEKFEELKKNKDINMLFLPGNKEWLEYKPKGLKNLTSTEKKIEKLFPKAFIPSDGCPGPKTKKLDENTLLISVNSGWFLTGQIKPEGTSSYCDLLFEGEFFEELEDIIDDNKDKNIIIAAHHPIYSNGYFAGEGFQAKEAIPIIGNLIHSYRNHDGNADFLSNSRYQHYRTYMQRILNKYQGLIYVSGHEYSIEIQNINNNIHINSGASKKRTPIDYGPSTLYAQNNPGFVCISYYTDGHVKTKVTSLIKASHKSSFVDYVMLPPCASKVAKQKAINYFYSDCNEPVSTSTNNENKITLTEKTVRAVPGIEYKSGGFRSWLMGKNFREEWTTPVQLPYLELEKEQGGLVPFAKGGGKQTNSLKLKTENGEQFAFRSVNKNTGRDPYDPFRNTIATIYTQELISNQLPFGDVVVSKLLDNTDILHMHPKPFIMPDDPALGRFRNDFAGVMATMEERPKGKKKKRKGFGNADIVISSNQMYKYLFEDNSNRVDATAFARAILFDIWVGDWDRHGDNWKWAGFKENKHYNFKPIPKDRDHVFSIWEGFIPSLAKNFLPFAAHFSEELGDYKSLTYQGRHFVNFVGSKLTEEDWLNAAKYLQSIFNSKNIDDAFEYMPAEIRAYSEERISNALLTRLPQLEKAASEVYKLFNKTGLIVGSNEREIFEIVRMSKDSLQITVKKFNKKKTHIFQKIFSADVTKEIVLYGLGKDDVFRISGNHSSTILIKIIGGKGEDKIEEINTFPSTKTKVKVYDQSKNDTIVASHNITRKNEYQDPNFNVYNYEYNSIAPLIAPSYTTDLGLYFLGLINFTSHGFNKPEFKHRINSSFLYGPLFQSFKLKAKHTYRYAIGTQDLVTRIRIAYRDLSFDDFYGLGNETRRISSLKDEGYYQINNNNYSISAGLHNQLFNKSIFESRIGIEYSNILPSEENKILRDESYRNLNGTGTQTNILWTTQLEIDFLNNSKFPTSGTKLNIEHTAYKGLQEAGDFFGLLEADITEYFSFLMGNPVTIGTKIGGTINYGETPFYHLSNLGNNNNLRNYSSNLLLGKSSVFANVQLRYSLGTVRNKIMPFNIGILAFYDTGRVFESNTEFSLSEWRYGYGAGFYISILDGAFNAHFTYGENANNDKFLNLRFGLGL